jgi:hypothetical protein
MTIMKLSMSFNHCPQSWQNFIRHLQEVEKSSYISIITVNKYLKEYDAAYFEKVSHSVTVMFNDPKLHTLFVMRWS